MMARETGEAERNAGKIAASLVGQRILVTVVVLGSLLGSCLSFFILRYEIPEVPVLGISILTWILLVTLGTAIILLFLFALALKEELTRRMVDSLLKVVVFISRGRWQLNGLKSRVQTARDAFHYAIKALAGHPSILVWPVVFSLMSWLFSLLVSWLVFVSLLGYPLHFGVVMIVHSLSCAIQSIPLGVPAEVGLTEVAMISLYTAFLRGTYGVANAGALSAAATFLIRLLTVGLRLVIGFVAIQWVGAKVLTGSSRRRSRQDEEGR
jgi:uncharacterized protein (TIRG00374 family)